MKDQSEYNVRAVERALHILACFDDQHPVRGVSEIAEAVGLHKATTFRILTTLSSYGFIERSPDGQKYRLGVRLIELGFKVLDRMDLREEALPHMNQFVQDWGETVDLSIFDRGEALYVEVLKSRHALTIAATVGQRLPAHCTASGKLFLAFLPAEEIAAILEKPLKAFTKNTITSTEHFLNQLAEIRLQNYATDNEEFEAGIVAISAPIFDQSNRIIAAVGVPGPSNRMTKTRVNEITPALIELAGKISHQMGWNGNHR